MSPSAEPQARPLSPSSEVQSAYDIVQPPKMSTESMNERRTHFEALVESLRKDLIDAEILIRDQPATQVDALEQGKTPSSSAQPSSSFAQSTTVFNSAAPMAAWIVVRPSSAQDVVNALQFCRDNDLSPSVRSGGFSTAGWSIQGDVVLDMRGMDKIRMLPRSARDNPKYLPRRTEGSNTKQARRSDDEAEQTAPLTQPLGDNGAKRRKGNEIASDNAAANMVESTRDGDSGAEADAESSSGSKSSNHGQSDPSDPGEEESRSPGEGQPFSMRDTQLRSAQSASALPSQGQQMMHSNSDQQSSGPDGITSEVASTTTAPTSVDVDMSDRAKRSQGGSSMEISSSSDNPVERAGVGQGLDRPAPGGATGRSANPGRLVLPTTGGFIWTAGDGSTGQPSMGTARPYNPIEPGFNEEGQEGRNLGSHDVDGRMDRSPTEGLHSGATPALSNMTLPWEQRTQPSGQAKPHSPSADYLLKPGIHVDKYVLVEFEPGVGVRDLDLFTDARGRSGFSPSEESPAIRLADLPSPSGIKGKAKMEQGGLSFLSEGGVPYHVPLSAYPVGSTAMTIGGFGYLSRAYGLSLDNIVEMDVVLADGRIKTLNMASTDSDDAEERDLWWAMRGAAPCFGIVTRIVAKAYPVPRVYAGNLIYPFNPVTAPSLLRHWRDCLKGTGESIPRELYSNLILTAGPPGEQAEHVIVIQVCYLGTSSTDEIGHNFVQAINSWTGERVLLKDISEKSFLDQQDGVAQVLKSGQGRRWMVRGDLLSTLTDEAIGKSIAQFRTMANRAVWLFELVGGAIEDGIDENGTCIGVDQRKARFTAGALQQWIDRDEDEACVRGVEAWVNDILAPISVGGPFPAFLERGESRRRCEGAFGEANFARLLQIKRQVDPKGMFRHTFGRGLVNFAGLQG